MARDNLELTQFLTLVDSIVSLVVHRYSSGIPDDVVEDLTTIYQGARWRVEARAEFAAEAEAVPHTPGKLRDDPEEVHDALSEVAKQARDAQEADGSKFWAIVQLADGNGLCHGCGCIVHRSFAEDHQRVCPAPPPTHDTEGEDATK